MESLKQQVGGKVIGSLPLGLEELMRRAGPVGTFWLRLVGIGSPDNRMRMAVWYEAHDHVLQGETL